MPLAVMQPADWDRVFVADLAPQRARLSEPEVMASAGVRPHITHRCVTTYLRCSLSRRRIALAGTRQRPAFGVESRGSTDGFSTGERNGSFAVKASSPVAASKRSLGSSVGSIPVVASSVASLSRNAAPTTAASPVMSAFFASSSCGPNETRAAVRLDR